MQITRAQLRIDGATWVDVNTNVGRNGLPDRLPDSLAIRYSSLFNILSCPIGGRGRTFQPRYGSILYELLQEPLDAQTAVEIRIGLLQAIQKWEPRITMDFSRSSVVPDYNLPGYKIKIVFTDNLSGQAGIADFVVARR